MSLTWGQLSTIVKRKAQSTKKNLPILGRVVRADCSDLSVHDLLRDDTCDPLCAKIKEIGDACMCDDLSATCFKVGIKLKVYCSNPATGEAMNYYFGNDNKLAILQPGMTLEDIREQLVLDMVDQFDYRMDQMNKNGSGFSADRLERVDLRLFPHSLDRGGSKVWYDVPTRLRKSANGIINPHPVTDKRVSSDEMQNQQEKARNRCGQLALLGALCHIKHDIPVALINRHPTGPKIKHGSVRAKMQAIKRDLWLPAKEDLWTTQDLVQIERKNKDLAISLYQYKMGKGKAHGVLPFRLSPKINQEGVTHVMMALVEPPQCVRDDPSWNGIFHWVAMTQRGLNTLTNSKCWSETQSGSKDATHTCPVCLHRFFKRSTEDMDHFKKRMADHQTECQGMCKGAPQKIYLPKKHNPATDEKREDLLKYRHFHAENEYDYTVVFDTEAFYEQQSGWQLTPASVVNPTVMEAKNKLCSIRAYLLHKGEIATCIGDTPFNGNFHAICDSATSDPGKDFIDWLLKVADLIKANYDANKRVPKLTPAQRDHQETETHCCICKKPLAEYDPDAEEDSDNCERYTVIHHDHNSGKYIGPAHFDCNMHKARVQPRLVVSAWNGRKYDNFMLMEAIANNTVLLECRQISALAKSADNFISFRIGAKKRLKKAETPAEYLAGAGKRRIHFKAPAPSTSEAAGAKSMTITALMQCPQVLKWILSTPRGKKNKILQKYLAVHEKLQRDPKGFGRRLMRTYHYESMAIEFVDQMAYHAPSSLDSAAQVLLPVKRSDFESNAAFRDALRTDENFEKMKAQMPILCKYFGYDREKIADCCCKSMFPYKFLTNPEVLKLEHLPSREAFFSKLAQLNAETWNQENTEAFEHAQYMMDKYCGGGTPHAFKRYLMLYEEIDTLLLAELCQKQRRFVRETFGLEMLAFPTGPACFHACMLKQTDVEVELLTDLEMLMMTEKSLRGGFTLMMSRWARANHEGLPNYDPEMARARLEFADITSSYPSVAQHKMPIGNYEWVTTTEAGALLDQIYTGYLQFKAAQPKFEHALLKYHDTLDTNMLISVTGMWGCPSCVNSGGAKPETCVACEDIWQRQCRAPIMPERLTVNEEWMADVDVQDYLASGQAPDAGKKLTATLFTREEYTVHATVLAYYMAQGFTVTKIHKAFTYTQQDFMREFIEWGITKRRNAPSTFEKNAIKLILNSVTFGKWLQSKRTYKNITLMHAHEDEFENMEVRIRRAFNSATFTDWNLWGGNGNLQVFVKRKASVTLNTPLLVGSAVLDLSKILLASMFYDNLFPKFGTDNVRQLYEDTDSSLFLLTGEAAQPGVFVDHIKSQQQGPWWDLSDFPANHTLHCSKNKKILETWGMECVPPAGSHPDLTNGIFEFAAAQEKIYTLAKLGGEKKTFRGCNRAILNKVMTGQKIKDMALASNSENAHLYIEGAQIANKKQELVINGFVKRAGRAANKTRHGGEVRCPHTNKTIAIVREPYGCERLSKRKRGLHDDQAPAAKRRPFV